MHYHKKAKRIKGQVAALSILRRKEMAIIIKGMSMPKKGECVVVQINGDGTVVRWWDLDHKVIAEAEDAD